MLSDTEKILLQALKICEVEEDAIIGIMLIARETNKAEELLDWIMDNPNCKQEHILQKVVDICQELNEE